MPRSLRLYLWDMKQASDDILSFTHGRNFTDYEAEAMLRAAVERKFGIIGEALTQMRRRFPDFTRKVEESREIIDFRNYLIHQYSTVDNQAVWAAVQSKLPAFREHISSLLREVETELQNSPD